MVMITTDFSGEELEVIEIAQSIYKLSSKIDAVKKLVLDSKEKIYKIPFERIKGGK